MPYAPDIRRNSRILEDSRYFVSKEKSTHALELVR